MVMARKKPVKEKDIIDQMLDTIDFRGLTQDEVIGQGGLIKQLTGRILQRTLEAEMTRTKVRSIWATRRIPIPVTTTGTAETVTQKKLCCWKTKAQP
jgi:hypothetical protein